MLKSLPKIITTFFLTIFILQMVCLIFLFALPQTGQAADVKFTPQVGIGTDFQVGTPKTFSDNSTKMIGEYVRAIYKYAIGIVGILAAVVLMIGGVMWIVAGGNATAIGEAKSWIGASLTGLLLALCSYFILATVNPALVNFKTTAITKVEDAKKEITDDTTGCCIIGVEDTSIHSSNTKKSDCDQQSLVKRGAGVNPNFMYFCPNETCKKDENTSLWSCSSQTKLDQNNCKNAARGTKCGGTYESKWCDGSNNCVGAGTVGQWCGTTEGTCMQGVCIAQGKLQITGGRDCTPTNVFCCSN